MELLDLYNENKELSGLVTKRQKGIKVDIPEGLYINVVLIFIVNSKGEFLMQFTSKEKGSIIATTGGHVKSGQTSLEAVLSEVKEELGIDIKNDDVKYLNYIKTNKVIFDIYYLKKDIDINSLILQKEEVESVMWLTSEQIEKMIEEDKIRSTNIKPYRKVIEYLKQKGDLIDRNKYSKQYKN